MFSYKQFSPDKFVFYLERYYQKEKDKIQRTSGRDAVLNLLAALRFKAVLHQVWYNKKRKQLINKKGCDVYGNFIPRYEQLDIAGKGTPLELIKNDLKKIKTASSVSPTYIECCDTLTKLNVDEANLLIMSMFQPKYTQGKEVKDNCFTYSSDYYRL